ncbi:MAG TPA: carbohydrate ABC transporter permease [Clostridia bacterium]
MSRQPSISRTTVFQTKLLKVFCYVVLALTAVFSMLPLWILLVNATHSHYEILGHFTLWFGSSLGNNLKTLFTKTNMPVMSALFNSLVIAASVAALTSFFSTMTAFGIHAYNFRFKKAAYTFILMTLMIPSQVSAAGFVKEMAAMNLNDTFFPLILPAIASSATVFFMRMYMQGALPMEVVEASRIDGANEFHTFLSIVMPIMKPAIAVQAIFAFIASWNNYFMPAMILNSNNKKTIPIIIASMRGADYMNQDYGLIYITLAVSIVPLIIIYLFLSRYIIRGVSIGSVKG